MIIGIALFPPAILAYVSQDALPGDLRYPVKRLVENGVMAIASVNPNTKAMFSVSQSNTRLKEMIAVAQKGEDTQSLIDEIIKQNEETVAEISRVSNVNRRQELIKEFQKNSAETQTKLAKAYQTQSASTAKTNNSANKTSTTTTTIKVAAKVECVVNGISLGLLDVGNCDGMKKLSEAYARNQIDVQTDKGGIGGAPTSTTPSQNTDESNQANKSGTGETTIASLPNDSTQPSVPPSLAPDRESGMVTVASIPTSPSSVIPYATPIAEVGVASIPTPPGSADPSAPTANPASTPNPSTGGPKRNVLDLSAATIWFPQPNDSSLEITCNSSVISVQMSGSSSNSVRFGRYKEYPATADPAFNTRNAIGDDSQGTGGYLLDSSFPIQVGVPVIIDLTDSNRSTIATYWVERGTVNTSGNYVIDRYVDFRCP